MGVPLLLLLILGAVWVGLTALMARSQLTEAQRELSQIRTLTGQRDIATAQARADLVSGHAKRARQLTSGPAWWVAAHIPWAGRPFHTAHGTTVAVDDLAQNALRPLIDSAARIDPAQLRPAGNRIDVSVLTNARRSLDRATVTLARVRTTVQDLPAHTWLSPVDRARTTLAAEVQSVSGVVHDADLAARLMPPMLGTAGPRRYFLAVQTEAEARGTGGLAGAFAIVTADRDKITFDRFESDSTLLSAHSSVDFGPEFNRLWGQLGAEKTYGNVNVSPHFPYAAQIWASMWQRKTGQHLDGAIALDPTTLSYLLAVTGPARMGSTQIGAGNIVALTEQQAYARFSTDPAARKRYLVGVAKAVTAHMLSGAGYGDPVALVRAAARSVDERRLVVYSSHPGEQSLLAGAKIGGTVPQTSAPYAGLIINNAGGNKLDYYLRRSLSYTGGPCTGPMRQTTVTVRLTNGAPAAGLPSYVTERNDKPSYAYRRGANRLLVGYEGTHGAGLTGVTVDGKATGAQSYVERGHPVFLFDLEFAPGQTRTLVLKLLEPSAPGKPVVITQPGITPQQTTVSLPQCRS